jgi:hypothetical protein
MRFIGHSSLNPFSCGPPLCSTHAAEATRGELETRRSSMMAVVRDIESLRERLQGELGQVRGACGPDEGGTWAR